jgi:CRISPR/Cas system-associated exonuclease Cas4 (RecB family)
MTMELRDMSSIEDVDRNRRVLMCVDERFDDIQGLGQNYTESIQKSLSALGPLKRAEMELLFKKWEFMDLFSEAEVTVLMNEGTLRHSLIWKRLFSEVELLKTDKEIQHTGKRLLDHLKVYPITPFAGTFSASKLQSFMDCPRKFYFNYVEKVFPNIVLEKDFDQMTSGTIIHEIIERFFKDKLTLDGLPELTRSIMQVYIKEKNLTLPGEVYLQRELIFNHRAKNGIQFILNVQNITGEKIEWKIEESFQVTDGLVINGRIDCLGEGSNYLFLLDFKSTEFSASSSVEVADYEAIQLWTYAYASKNLVKDYEKKEVVLGYVVLDDPSKSNLLTVSAELAEKIKEAKLCKIHKFKEEFSLKLTEAHEKMKNLADTILNERVFSSKPRKPGACLFCELNKVCVKSEVQDVQDA